MSRFWASMLAYRHIIAVFSFYWLGSYTVLIVSVMENDHPSLPVLYDAKWKFDYVYLNVYDLTPVLDNK
jgi:hypothetical protein